MSLLAAAYDAACQDFAADRVVADRDLNRAFIDECRRLGLTDAAVDLNRGLLNLRKQGRLARRAKLRRTHFRDQDQYAFASEIAIRILERRDGVSLDTVICDPDIADEFDSIAFEIAPGFSSLQYRWAALSLRKRNQLPPEITARVASKPLQVATAPVKELDIASLPESQGLYLFFTSKELLYVGECSSLRQRLKKHLDHSDRRELARWIWEFGLDQLHVEWHVLESDTTPRVRKALELELIRSRHPLFNVQR